MEALTQLLSQYPEHLHYFVLGGAIMLTAMGLFPGSTDLFIISGGVLSGQGALNTTLTFITCTVALILGETIVYLIGKNAGVKIINKIKPGLLERPRFVKVSKLVSHNPKSVIFSHRFVPALRPYVLMSAASMGLKHKDFLKYHPLLITSYVTILIIFSDHISKFFK